MSRPITLFTGQWADLPLAKLAPLAKQMGYDGLELACWGDHFEVDKAIGDKAYVRQKWALLKKHGLNCYAISNHLVGQAVCDHIDLRHKAILPADVWGDGKPEGVRQRAAAKLALTAQAARRFFDAKPKGLDAAALAPVVNGFTGSSIWHSIYGFPPTSQEYWDAGFRDFALRFEPILAAFEAAQVNFALEVHPTEIAFDTATAARALEAVGNHPRFGFNYDPSHLGYQGVDYVDFIRRFEDRIFHVHLKDVWWGHGDGSVGVFGGHAAFGDARRFWDFRSPGRGDIRFEDIIVALNRARYTGPLSVEWEDSQMDRVHGATEAAEFGRQLSFPPAAGIFDSAFAQEIMKRKLRFGMIGGGRGAFIGAVHRLAAAMDGEAELVAGAFSSDPERSRASGADLGLDPQRVYGSYTEMADAEAAAPLSRRLDFVVIVTPNFQHFPPAALFLKSGFNVVCDKPVTFSLAEAKKLAAIVKETRQVFVLTHNYTGNAMVKQARELVRSGKLGKLRKIVVEYPQGWLASKLEGTDNKQAGWRTDPKRSGAAGCLGDVGTHAENLARYITGLHISELCADLTAFVPGRRLDDDANILVRWEGGVKGVLHSSQISVGEENNLNIRIYGTEAGLEWHQEHPNELIVKYPDRPAETWRRGNGYLTGPAKAVARIPAGHPEGYLEAFANVYRDAFRAIRAQVAGEPQPKDLDFPTIADGVEGMAFLETAVKSSNAGAKWRKLTKL